MSEFKTQNIFKIKTNTAYLLNEKVFDGWEYFTEFIETKHEQAWQNKNEFDVEVIFKFK